jgi:putative serine protease PepD
LITPLSPPQLEPAHETRPEGRPRSRRTLALVSAAALVGAGAAAAAFLATGAIRAEPATTVTRQVTVRAEAGSLAALYARAAPGVVDLTVRVVTLEDTPFGPQRVEGTQTGTGAVLDAEGRILTVEHVVEGAQSIKVKFQDGTTRKGRLLGKDSASDIALLRVDPSGLTLYPLTLGSVESLRVGDALFLVGDPFGYARSLSTGVVSALDRTITAPNGFTVAHAIQTDTAMNPGNSGGPLFDAAGRVVGIADQIATGGSSSSTSTGVGFAIPIDVARSGLAQLERGVKPAHAYLGVGATDATSSTGRSGALVQTVRAGSPAATAGVKRGDLVIAVDASRVDGAGDLVAAVAGQRPADRITLTLLRDGKRLSVEITLARQPASSTG